MTAVAVNATTYPASVAIAAARAAGCRLVGLDAPPGTMFPLIAADGRRARLCQRHLPGLVAASDSWWLRYEDGSVELLIGDPDGIR